MIREYKTNDYNECIEILAKVWKFDERYKPPSLAILFKKIYLLESLSLSNIPLVIYENNVVQGFLFGNCGNENLYKNEYSGFIGAIKLLFDLFFMKGVSIKRKLNYLKMIKVHEKNREKIEPLRKNEVNLFAVNPESQGKGYGRELLQSFIEICKKEKVTRITLDTDKESNYKFYYHFGFSKKGEFFSPLQKEYTGNSGNSFVLELLIK